ncbi:hsp70 nucleotide exchange factor fes1 [Mortierella sp. AD010]|nr:hsp70 nucleotide exchange factor fes1 [Mortierella sp. AD010]
MSQQKSLNELLKWSIINQATESEDASAEGASKKPMEKLDPELIDAILGKSESQMMLEALTVIKNPQASIDEKELAWEDFEMLIEQIDNASMIELLSDPETYVRAKAIYALSGAIKHFEPALEEFKNMDGYKTLITLLKTETDIPLLRKTVFLINTLLIQDPASSKQLAELELVHTLHAVLTQHIDDEDLTEKSLVTLRTFLDVTSSPIHPMTLASIRPKVLEAKEKYSQHILDSEAWSDLEKKLA